jgi:hypothetical protein
MCNSIFGKGQQAVENGVCWGLTAMEGNWVEDSAIESPFALYKITHS